MTDQNSQDFLREMDKKLWTAADRLRSNLDAAVYKHAVLGLIFLKYVSDSFAQRQAEIREHLTDVIAGIPFQHADFHAKDFLEHIYDWGGATETLTKESPKGWRGGAHPYFAPKLIVSLIVEMIESYKGRLYNSAMGFGCFFVQPERFIVKRSERDSLNARPARKVSPGARIHQGGKLGNLLVYGQDQWAWGGHWSRAKRARRVRLRLWRTQSIQSNPNTWRFAAMNLDKSLPRQSAATLGGINSNFFTNDQHPYLRADYVMALPSTSAYANLRNHTAYRPAGRMNPPFHIKEW